METITQELSMKQNSPRPAVAGSGATLALMLQARTKDSILPLGDSVVLPLMAVTGTKSVTVEIDRPFPWIAMVSDPGIVAACRYIALCHDLHAVLDAFPGVSFHRGDDGEWLTTFALDTAGFADSILVLRDACAAVLSVAYGMAVMDEGLPNSLDLTNMDRSLHFARFAFTEAVRVHTTGARLGRAL